MSSHTSGPWELRDRPSAGLEIYATVNLGPDERGGVLQPVYEVAVTPSLKVLADGSVQMCIAYESYRQFPSEDFKAMQQANGRLIAKAPEMLAELQQLREENAQLKAAITMKMVRETS